jgi:hypothetical protein
LVGGAFLSLLYFDVPYYLMAAMAITRVLMEKELKEKAAARIKDDGNSSQPQFGPLSPPQPQPIIRGDSS